MQIIVLTETRRKANTDYQYVRRFINISYPDLNRRFAINHVPMTSKSEYCHCEKQIKALKDKYSFAHKGDDAKSFVVYFVDTDYGGPSACQNKDIESYCKENGYLLVWFHRTVEEVFLGKIVKDVDKKSCADKFSFKGDLSLPKSLSEDVFKATRFGTSNIKNILDSMFGEIMGGIKVK